MPKVSVIMNCFNNEKHLREAIESVYAQTFKDWEIMLWDDASADKSADIARSYGDRVKYYKSDCHLPLGHVRNLAIEKAEGEFLAILDCDDIWMPDKIEKQLPLFENPEVGIVYCDVLQFNDRGYSKLKYGTRMPPQGRLFDKLVYKNHICVSSVMIRSDVIKKHNNWFDPEFTAIEDTDLFIRISRNWDIAYVPEALCKYRMHTGSFSYLCPLTFRQEEELMINKFSNIFPEFASKYERKCREQILRDRAVVEWKQGKRSAGRSIVRPIIFNRPKYLFDYFVMFLPYEVVRFVRERTSRSAISNY